MSEPGRGRYTERERIIRLCDDDRRKLYGVLDADLAVRLRRIEIGMAALFVMSSGQLAGQLGSPITPTSVVGFLAGFL